ncbi:hypothetical protein HDU87_000592 [Geranomyces variabilis]|uniref:HIG1 domain-containing protein n=1 Tax=Geranomyces variabilis TaxID=109894 RepID=A0AAD5XNT2_9FUNG|nr:hypothetical protein HDU87_000592 [Geranomyces variabilis]
MADTPTPSSSSSPSQPPKPLLVARFSQEEKDARHSKVLWAGAKSVAVAAPLGVAASLLAQRNIAFYRRLSMPFKTFIALMIPTAVFFTVTDRAAMHADREHAMQFSVTRQADMRVPAAVPHTETPAEFVFRNRYTIIGWGWASTLGAALLYNARRTDITRSMKIINSRMTAQTFALVGIGAIAALASSASSDLSTGLDPHFERVVNGGRARERASEKTIA